MGRVKLETRWKNFVRIYREHQTDVRLGVHLPHLKNHHIKDIGELLEKLRAPYSEYRHLVNLYRSSTAGGVRVFGIPYMYVQIDLDSSKKQNNRRDE